MTLLGLDFDNTLVGYDNLFHQLAVEANLISRSFPKQKMLIRDHLIKQGQEDKFTLLQGEVYGGRILEAEPTPGMLKTLKRLNRKGYQMVLVSHKTKTPYIGPQYDLHGAALSWLEKYDFFNSSEIGWTKENIYFAETKAEKAEKIKQLDCTYYVDDLIEILEMLPRKIERILYSPQKSVKDQGLTIMRSWEELDKILAESKG